MLIALAIGFASRADALPEEKARVVVNEARKILGVPYELGGRLRTLKDGRVEGTDCQGLVFFALQAIAKCGWKSWSVMPTTSIAAQEMGAPVEGLAPVATAQLDVAKLRAGDVIHFVGGDANPAEGPITKLDGKDVWVWHMAMSSDGPGGKFIVGDHFAGAVVELDLRAYLVEHAAFYQGIFVTRIEDAPKPASESKCRTHAPMKPPRR